MKFQAGGKQYSFEIVDRFSRRGADRTCITVEISDDQGRYWVGQTDILNVGLSGLDVLLAIWLAGSFGAFELEKVPRNFQIPTRRTDTPIPCVHRCVVR